MFCWYFVGDLLRLISSVLLLGSGNGFSIVVVVLLLNERRTKVGIQGETRNGVKRATGGNEWQLARSSAGGTGDGEKTCDRRAAVSVDL